MNITNHFIGTILCIDCNVFKISLKFTYKVKLKLKLRALCYAKKYLKKEYIL